MVFVQKWRHRVEDYKYTYNSWVNMRQRCLNTNYIQPQYYSARGIEICERWKNNFDNFVDDMGVRPEGTTLDRINNDGNYTPENCRWATIDEQNCNKSNSKFYELDGVKVHQLTLVEKWGIDRKTLSYRVAKGMDLREALEQPVSDRVLRHGTRSMYKYCRCEECREAENKYRRERRANKKNLSQGISA